MRICFQASKTPKSQEALASLKSIYEHHPISDCDVIVALGGDGFMIETIHNILDKNIPIYGMNRGTVGFLLNSYKKTNLVNRIEKAIPFKLHPLKMHAKTLDRKSHTFYAINEVSLLRHTNQAANIEVSVNNKVVIDNMMGDGILVSTPAGSTAYNTSAFGPILPLQSNILAITPLSPFCPKRWKGAIVTNDTVIDFKVLQPKKRPINASADFQMVENISRISICEDKTLSFTLLFDENHDLENRITKEQFS